MTWKLYLDDVRDPMEQGWTVARSSVMGVVLIVDRKELPVFMSLDHDLGEGDDTMRFLKELHHIWNDWGADPELIPGYIVHSANFQGAKNIVAFMESWKKSAHMP